jgi:hypothetical protein
MPLPIPDEPDAHATNEGSPMEKMSRREVHDSGFVPWPISWSGIWVGALAAVAVSLVVAG